MSPVERDPRQGLNAAIAAELRAAKARLGLRNEDIAEASGISVPSVQRYLAATRDINVATLSELCRVLRVEPSDVMEAALRHSRNN